MLEHLTEVIELISQADLVGAIRILEDMDWDDSTEPKAYWCLGLTYLLLGEIQAAQEPWLSYLLPLEPEQAELALQDLTNFLKLHLSQEIDCNRLGNAKLIYEAIVELYPDYENIALRDKLVDAIALYASSLSFNKEYTEAITIYEEALELNPNHGDILHSLALTHYHLENYQEAEALITKAIAIDETRIDNYLLLAKVLEKQDRWQDAVNICQQALEYDQKKSILYEIVGRNYTNLKQWDKALSIYQQALSHHPKNNFFLQKLSDIYSELGDEKNKFLYQGYADYYSKKNSSLMLALDSFQKYLEIVGDDGGNDFDFYNCLANAYVMCNQTELAIKTLDQALSLFPKNCLEIKRLHQSVLPVLYSNQKEIEFYHHRFNQLLDEIVNQDIPRTAEGKADLIHSIAKKNNFYLAYQNHNDLETYKKYGDYVHKIMEKAKPDLCQKLCVKPGLEATKIRIGLISERLQGLGRLYLGWVRYLNKEKFEFYIYSLCEVERDSPIGLEEKFQEFSDRYTWVCYSMKWDDICQMLVNDHLDVLIFPDFGVDPILNLLAYLRFAPVQCTTWGHPVTSGSPTIDYFLSSDLMEPDNGDEHYSETLIRLPNLAFSLPPVELPVLDKTREEWQLGEDRIVYLCSQALYKYLPQHDYLFAAIAAHSSQFQFVFVDPVHGEVIRNCFAQRLDRAFAEYDLNYRDYCVFLPRLSNEDFLKVNQLADIFLDCLSWSGGLTTHQAISCNLPIVTCPGEFMRARHSYAMLRMIDVTETIAQSSAEYIEIAVKLGTDYQWRQEIRELLARNKYKLFDDQECIKGLEEFLYNAVAKRVA
jgi:predicted O-linked N-acetylglucosamine transferase (SPINDLY family)